jgi:ABC-type polar amino acid transport system ATPase subunit
VLILLYEGTQFQLIPMRRHILKTPQHRRHRLRATLMRTLAANGSIMLVVSHKMGFVREASSRIGFMAGGQIVELCKPDDLLEGARDSRAVYFFSRVAKR